MKNRSIQKRSVKKMIPLFWVGMIFLSSGCLPSPLLNHADASDSASKSQSLNADCPQFLSKSRLCAAIEWVQRPTDEEKGEFLIRFWDKETGTANAGPYTSPREAVGVKLWMASMGHGSAPVKVQPFKDASGGEVPGTYQASEVYFVMPGTWEIWIQLKENKKVVEEVKFDFVY